MNTTIKSVHFDADELTKELIETRLQKLEFAADKIEDMDFTLTKEKDHSFELEAKIHFRWGQHDIVKNGGYELHKAITELIDKVDQKVRKEVDRIQDHKN
jgi:putative sigma-54 modulation protein